MTNAELIDKLRILQGAILNPHHRDGEYVDKRFADVCVDAADALEADEKRIAELEAQLPKWISVGDRLPNEAGEYLVAYHPCCWNDVKTVITKVGIDEQPTVDAVQVVRCRECEHRKPPTDYCEKLCKAYVPDDFYCKYGERR